GVDRDAIDYFYVSDSSARYHAETFERLGIDRRRVVTAQWRRHIVADELVVPSLVGRSGAFPDWVMRFHQRLWWPKDEGARAGGRRLYLNRNRVTYRRVTNEPEIERLLASRGFESVAMEDHSVAEQAAIMHDADVVVAPHGAALANIMFCRPGTKVIELHNRRLINNMYWSIAGELGLDYAYQLSDPQPAADSCLENEADLRFDTEGLGRLLDLVAEQSAVESRRAAAAV
ncbi:MAG: glycosyltransferase family 61 protein, partial [Planctomycetota bacterium]